MALTRARVVAGNRSFAHEVETALHQILTHPRDPAKLAGDVAAMRRRMAQQHPGDRLFDLKHLAGGLIDIEFIAQYLMLRHAAKRPTLLAPSTDAALVALARAEILSEEDFARLRGALSVAAPPGLPQTDCRRALRGSEPGTPHRASVGRARRGG
jgi:glutamate-ammonia-ligase adenylyltransferase